MNFLVSLMISIILCGALYIALKFMKAKQLKRENKMLGAYMESLEGFCTEINKRIDAIRKYRHDLKGYIQTLEAILATEQPDEEVVKFISEQNDRCYKLKEFEFCSDEFINTVISLKAEECEKNGIPVRFNIEEGDYSKVEEIDKVCLIINLLDNAIEATQKLGLKQNPEIIMEMHCNDKCVTISLQNTIVKNAKITFRTTKKDAQNHGLGTAIIRQVVEKYNGTRNTMIDKEKGVLKDEICLYFEKDGVSI